MTNVEPANLDRQCLFTQAETIAGAAGAVVLKAFEFFADPVTVGLAVATFHVRNYALERARDLINTTTFVIAELDFFFARAAQEHLLVLGV